MFCQLLSASLPSCHLKATCVSSMRIYCVLYMFGAGDSWHRGDLNNKVSAQGLILLETCGPMLSYTEPTNHVSI